MLSVLASRLGQAVLVMLAVTAVAFLMFRYRRRSGRHHVAGGRDQSRRSKHAPALGLDQPIVVQYGQFLGRIVSGDLGTSYRNQRPVRRSRGTPSGDVRTRLVATILSLAAGIPLGVLCALSPAGLLARLIQTLSLIGISTPTFVTGIALILVFAVSLQMLPSFGRGDVVRIGWWTTGFLTVPASSR